MIDRKVNVSSIFFFMMRKGARERNKRLTWERVVKSFENCIYSLKELETCYSHYSKVRLAHSLLHMKDSCLIPRTVGLHCYRQRGCMDLRALSSRGSESPKEGRGNWKRLPMMSCIDGQFD